MGLPRASGITQQTGWGSNQSSHSASITTSKIPRQLWLVGLSTRHLAHTRKVAGSILGRCHQIFQFHYISCFLWCRFRKSWSGVQKTPQKCSRSPPKSRFLTLPDPRIRLLPKAASTPLHPKSFPALPNVYPDPGSPLFSSEKAPKSRQKSGKTTQNGSFGLCRFLPNAPADRTQIFREPQERQKEVPCQIWSSHHFWLAQNSPGKILSGVLFKNFFRGFTPDLRGEIRRGHTLPDGDQSLKISKP